MLTMHSIERFSYLILLGFLCMATLFYLLFWNGVAENTEQMFEYYPDKKFPKTDDIMRSDVSEAPPVKNEDVFGDIPFVDEMSSLGLERNAFYLETSGSGRVSLRQLLGVESAARNLRDLRNLFVFIVIEKEIKEDIFFKTPIMNALEARYPVIQFRLVNFKDFIRGPALEGWYNSEAFKKTQHRTHHVSDLFRAILVANYGGVYFDFDVHFQRWWTFPNDSLFWENTEFIGNEVLAFSRNHPFITNFVTEFVKNYNPVHYSYNGPELVKSLFLKCNTTRNCDLVLFPSQQIAPLHFTVMKEFFDDQLTQSVLERSKSSFALHISSHMVQGIRLLSSSQSAIAVITRMNCPIVWEEIMKIGYV